MSKPCIANQPAPRIAILAWGSLLWDRRADFDSQHGRWSRDGPVLELEFSRVSHTRLGALTLVIDTASGHPCKVAYSLSKRVDLKTAIDDLRSREGTSASNIGCLSPTDLLQPSTNDATTKAIREWARKKKIDAVIWTALPSNFAESAGNPFSVKEAKRYIRRLDARGKQKAEEYLQRAPKFVDTPLRRATRRQAPKRRRKTGARKQKTD